MNKTKARTELARRSQLAYELAEEARALGSGYLVETAVNLYARAGMGYLHACRIRGRRPLARNLERFADLLEFAKCDIDEARAHIEAAAAGRTQPYPIKTMDSAGEAERLWPI